MTETINKKKCLCLSCENIFSIEDAAKAKRKLYNIEIEEKRCPECNGDFKILYVPRSLDKYLDINRDPRYYNYNNSCIS